MVKSSTSEKNVDKKTYKPDNIIKEISVPGNIHAKIIHNGYGYFVDIRQYLGKFPTKKGIRLHLVRFKQLAALFEPEIDKILKRIEDQ